MWIEGPRTGPCMLVRYVSVTACFSNTLAVATKLTQVTEMTWISDPKFILTTLSPKRLLALPFADPSVFPSLFVGLSLVTLLPVFMV